MREDIMAEVGMKCTVYAYPRRDMGIITRVSPNGKVMWFTYDFDDTKKENKAIWRKEGHYAEVGEDNVIRCRKEA